MSPPTVLVTGASGFIGSWMVSALARELRGSSIIGMGRRPERPTHWRGSNIEYIACDPLQRGTLKNSLPGQIDVVMHFAGDARTSVGLEDWTRQLEANVVLTSLLADYAVSAKAKLFLLASSVYVYSGSSTLPFGEEVVSLPVENLGASKLAAEALVKARALAGQFQSIAFRIFTAYGAGSRPNQFIPEAIRKLRSKDDVAQFGSPDVKRDFIYVEDVVAAFLAGLVFNGKPRAHETLNVGSGTPVTIKEVVCLLAEILEVKKRIEFIPSAQNANGSTRDHQADLQRIKEVLGWKPKVPLKAGLRRMIEHTV